MYNLLKTVYLKYKSRHESATGAKFENNVLYNSFRKEIWNFEIRISPFVRPNEEMGVDNDHDWLLISLLKKDKLCNSF